MKPRLPLFVVAAALLGLLAVLATLQYRWLGRISEAERDRRSATLAAQAQAFADDFDRELTRAYLLFQWEPTPDVDSLVTRVAGRHERWLATARFPRLIRDVFIMRGEPGSQSLQRFNPAGPVLEPSEWPASLEPMRNVVAHRRAAPDAPGTTLVRVMPPLWDAIPAIVVPLPVVVMHPPGERSEFRISPALSHAVLMLDREYMTGEMLPALADQHFGRTPDGADFRLAVVRGDLNQLVYRSIDDFTPTVETRVDASAAVFRMRPQEFGEMASEIRRFSAIVTAPDGQGGQVVVQMPGEPGPQAGPRARIELRELTATMAMPRREAAGSQDRTAIVAGAATAFTSRAMATTAQWRLLVQHRAGSLEAAVDATRRRNLAISSGVLGLLGVSMGFLVVSTRRAQRLARQQMEFVAAVSHELRTPLAVIRSAGDNLADGVVGDDRQVRQYGDLVRREGRRLTEMVEQILEFAGIDSGQRAFVLAPVSLRDVAEDVIEASRPLIEGRGLAVEVEIPRGVPAVLADEGALRRVVQNLIGNAIKYGAGGGVVRVEGAASGREVRLAVADKGMGIAPSEQQRIFEPFYRAPEVVAAQIQGAGLGLSLVKRIVEAHGGRIGVRSAPGAGSEFTVWLPAASEDPAARIAGAAPAVDAHQSRA